MVPVLSRGSVLRNRGVYSFQDDNSLGVDMVAAPGAPSRRNVYRSLPPEDPRRPVVLRILRIISYFNEDSGPNKPHCFSEDLSGPSRTFGLILLEPSRGLEVDIA